MAGAQTAQNKGRWPTPQEYNEAVQNPHHDLTDPELQTGTVKTDAMGIPRPITGAFASVYRFHCKQKDWAVRCFLHQIPDSQWRYECISDFVQKDDLTYTVGFEFQPAGIRVGGIPYPILKMEWIEGQTLDAFLHKHGGYVDKFLVDGFKQMCSDLNKAGIAHGDLQHGNIIVQEKQLFLVDYDGMFVPSMRGSNSNELGHRHYQHPQRKAQHFGAYLDNFSSWVIYTSLAAVHADPRLFERLGGGEDCLLFRQEDFADPVNSCVFKALEQDGNEELKHLARCVRAALQLPLDQVPPLDATWQPTSELPPIADDAPRTRHESQKRKAALHIESLPQQQMQRPQRPSGNVQVTTQTRSQVNLVSPSNVRLVAGPTPPAAAGSAAAAPARTQSQQQAGSTNYQAPGIPVVTKSGFIEPELHHPTPRQTVISARMPMRLLVGSPSNFVPIMIGAMISFVVSICGAGAPAFLVCLVCLALLFIAIPKTSPITEAERKLVATGLPAVATITQKLVGQHRALCSFTDRKGEQHLVLVRVPDNEMPYLNVGDQLTILYDAISPTTQVCFYRFAAYQAAAPLVTSLPVRQPVKVQQPEELSTSLAELRSAIADLKQSTANLSATRAAAAKNRTLPPQNPNKSQNP